MLQAADWTWPMVQPHLHDDCQMLPVEPHAHQARREVNNHEMHVSRFSQSIHHVLRLDYAYSYGQSSSVVE